MFKNYFYLARAAGELNNSISGSIIREIYSQEKDKLFFNIGDEQSPFKHLIISCIPHLPYLQIRKEHRKAKKNIAQFFRDFLPAQIESVSIADEDRIIKIKTSSCDFYFAVRGGSTNFFIIDEDELLSFKKTSSEVKQKLHSTALIKFCSIPQIPDVPETVRDEEAFRQLRKKHVVIPKDLGHQIAAETNFPVFSFGQKFKKLIDEILFEKIEIGNLDGGLRWFPAGWTKPDGFESEIIIGSYLEAIDYLIANYHRRKKKQSEAKIVGSKIQKELDKLSSKLNRLKDRIEKGSRSDEYRKIGDLLLANLSQIGKGHKSVELLDFETGKKVEIRLKPHLSPQENVKFYFDKSKDEKTAYQKSREIFVKTKADYEKLQEEFEKFEKTGETDDSRSVVSSLKLKGLRMNQKQGIPGFKYRKFIIEGKYECFVGRDSKSNDYLSVKFAKQNDYWFHARGLAGSHTLLRVQNTKENVPKPVIKQAASIAAFFSKGKTASIVPVSYTFAKYVYKKKGMEPGQVLLSKEKSILVRPEIPSGVEQVEI